MKIGGRTDLSTQETIELIPPREEIPALRVMVKSLPFGFQENLAKEIPEPTPPNEPVIDPRTGKEKIIPGTHPPQILTAPNKKDPEYKKKEAEHNRLAMAYYIYHGTNGDPNIEWETNPEEMSKPDFYANIYQELLTSKIGFGHMLTLQQKILEISGCSLDQIRRVRKAFLESEESEAQSGL